MTAQSLRENEMAEETGPDAKIIKARGLPWSASADEVLAFFSECKVIGGTAGVHFGMNREGRPSGEAFIEVEDELDVEAALRKDKGHMGKRYIEVFESQVTGHCLPVWLDNLKYLSLPAL